MGAMLFAMGHGWPEPPARQAAPIGAGLRSPHKGTAGGASPGRWAPPHRQPTNQQDKRPRGLEHHAHGALLPIWVGAGDNARMNT